MATTGQGFIILVGAEISQDLPWHEHVVSFAAARPLETDWNSCLATLYKAQVRQGLE